MAIVKKFLETRDDGINLYITYSDENKFIRKIGTNEFYTEAIDVEGTPYEYTETNEVIVSMEEQMKYLEEIDKKIDENEEGV